MELDQPRQHQNLRIIVRFTKLHDRQMIKRNASKLKGTRIYVDDNLCKASQAKSRDQLSILWHDGSEGAVALFSHTRLVVRQRRAARPENMDTRHAASMPVDPVASCCFRASPTSVSVASGAAAPAVTPHTHPRLGTQDPSIEPSKTTYREIKHAYRSLRGGLWKLNRQISLTREKYSLR